jgi:maltose O-acetyltransferase
MINPKEISIHKAHDSDGETLTEISFSAKRHWNYPEHYFDIWKDELTITEEYINKNIVYKAVVLESVLGFYSIVENENDFWTNEIFVKKGFWLEHIFIRPEFHQMGIGRVMIDHAKIISRSKGIGNLLIFVDPFAKGFYDKIGAEYLYESNSSIPLRRIPVYDLKI